MKNLDIDNLISKVDIVNVISSFSSLIKAGTSYKTLCNVHGDKTPSLSINPRKQIYKCFVCDHGGNALDYLIWAQKFSFQDAISFLINESGENPENFSKFLNIKKYSDKQLKIFKALEDASNLFNYFLNIYIEENNEISKFIKSRNLSKEVINKFKLGFAPNTNEENYIDLLLKKDNEISTLINSSLLNESGTSSFFNNKLIFPIFDEDNKIVAFSGRKIDDNDSSSPKYLNSRESLVFKKNSIIFNYNRAKKFENIIIVEGYMDVIAFSKIGFDNVIALMGVSLSDTNINKLKKHKEIILFLDNDGAGKIATLKIIRLFILNGIKAKVVNNKTSKDPDEILNEENGNKKLKDILNSNISMVDFVFNHFIENVSKDDFENIRNAIIEIYKYSKKFDDFVKLDLIKRISNRFEIDKEIVLNYFDYKPNMVELNKLKNKNINTKQTLEIELNEPLNINKLLISIWQNPSFLKSQNIVNVHWPKAEFIKIYEEIKKYYDNGTNLSSKSQKFIEEKSKLFNSKESLPKDLESFEELIIRTHKDSKNTKLSYLDELLSKTNDPKHKEKLLNKKLELLKKENK